MRWRGDAQGAGRGEYRDKVSGRCGQLDKVSRVSRHRAEEALIVGRSEEGARFPISMVSSGVWAGEIPLERAHNLQEVGGGTKTMKQELERIGFLGDMDASYKAMPIGVGVILHL